ncbi:MAG: hypothetical protein Q9157_002019 [Trypethelium eluteriae]
MPSKSSERPHVLILGAGLAGLALAQGLRKQGVSFQIFERDEGLHARFQGWAIALHMMLSDLKQSVPSDLSPVETTSHLNPLDLPAQFCMYGEDGSRFAVTSTEDKPIVRANRSRLREWLATKVDVEWNKTMAKIEEDEKSVTVHFTDGTSATGDVLVGCDGVHSFVRNYLFPNQDLLHTSPVGLLVGQVTLNREQYERQLSIGHSIYIAVAPKGSRLFVGLNSISQDKESARYYWFVSWPDQAASQEPYWTATASKQESYDTAVEKTETLDPKLTEIIRLTKAEDMMTPPVVFRDMLPQEIPDGRVLLAGDAAHPMTPARGEGGNHAILDSLNLARALGKSNKEDVKVYLKEYQEEMIARNAEAVTKARFALADEGTGTKHGAWGQGRKN